MTGELAVGGRKEWKVFKWFEALASPKVEVPAISGRFGTNDDPPIVPGVEGSSKPPGCGWSMSIVRPGEPGALRAIEGIPDVEDLSGH